ncbi:MAG: rhombosortase [Planctomycetaceae bacterium]|nr:rhombosortase [Planctomycetaceae bacterium]
MNLMTKETPMTNIECPRSVEESLRKTIGIRASAFVIPSSFVIPPITLGVAILSLALMCSANLSEILQFDREAVAAGQLWRVVTGHFTHWNLDHLFWDGVVFAVLGVLCERRQRGRFMLCLTAAAVLIPASVWLLLPELNTYRGLSGLDTALFTMLAGSILAEKWAAREWRWVTIIAGLMIGLGSKIAFEVFTQGTMFVDTVTANFQPVPLAHVVGALAGIVVAMLPELRAPAGT